MEKVLQFIERGIQFVLTRVLCLKITNENLEKIIQFVKFSIVGVMNTLVSYIVYVILISINLHYLLANIAGVLVSMINAFYWNNRYVFGEEEIERRSLWNTFWKMFTSYVGTGLIVNNILLMIWIDILNIYEVLAPVLNLFITVPLNFVLNKYWAFKATRENKNYNKST